jgi:hypothetical protein
MTADSASNDCALEKVTIIEDDEVDDDDDENMNAHNTNDSN